MLSAGSFFRGKNDAAIKEKIPCQAFLKMSQKIFKIGPDGFGAYLL